MRRLLVILLAVCCGATACGSDSGSVDVGRTTDTESSAFADNNERVGFLVGYTTVPSPVLDTQFHIFYHDNSTGRVPGPSDWTIRYAVRVAPADLASWTDGFTIMEPPQAWDESMLDGWTITTETPVFYQGSGLVRAVYEADNVVVGYATT